MSSPPWTRTTFARGGKPSVQGLSFFSFCGSGAVRALRIGSLRHHAARDAAAHGPLWGLLFCVVCGFCNRSQLADVSDRPVKQFRKMSIELAPALPQNRLACVGFGIRRCAVIL